MPRGSCLCGAVSWSVEGELKLAHTCHCSMCRKVHGTGYGAYASVAASGFRWTSGADGVRSYATSETGKRRFCGRCGSIVPNLDASGESVGIPLGSLEGPGLDVKLLAHIFVGSKASWGEIGDALPQFDAWPPGYDFPVQATPDRGSKTPDRIGGSCLCGGVAYEVTAPLAGMRHCHCSRCRRGRSAPHASNAFCNLAAFRFTRGEELLRSFKVPDAQFFAQTFCTTCGAKMPRVSPERDLVVIPAGSFYDDPRVRPSEHIFVGSKATWFQIGDTLPQRIERT